MSEYFKFKNSYDPKHGEWWLYSRIIRHNNDDSTCQVFQFQKTSREEHYVVGMDTMFKGSIDSNRYEYYEDLHEPCTKEEFERELKLFMEDLNNYVESINYSP